MHRVGADRGAPRRAAGRELILEDARSISEGRWQMAQLAQHAAEALDAKIEDEDLEGAAEAEELGEALDQVRAICPAKT